VLRGALHGGLQSGDERAGRVEAQFHGHAGSRSGRGIAEVDVHRVVAEVLGVPLEKCDVTWGNTSKNLPWTCVSGGSQTTHAMTRAAHAAAMDGKQKLQEIAAKTLGGKPEQYEVANERVFRKGGAVA
jgi:CO/xanthine dehydrogenase Mo-binding subunit